MNELAVGSLAYSSCFTLLTLYSGWPPAAENLTCLPSYKRRFYIKHDNDTLSVMSQFSS
jgi:hypothetical protein